MVRLLACALAAAVAAGAFAVRLFDDRGVAVSVEHPAERIVTLAPHLAEIAYAAGAGARLVGVSDFSQHPADVQQLPVVANSTRIDVERLITLKPDAVLAWRSGNSPLQIARLERLGIRVFVTEVRSLADIARVTRLVGALAGSSEIAGRQAQLFETEIADLRERYTGTRQVAVFVEIWHRPRITVSGEHLISDAIGVCGGRNVFARAKTITPLISTEQLLGAGPEAIITSGYGSEAPQAWRGLETVPAVRDRRIYAIDADLLHAQGPRVVEGVRALCRRLEWVRK